MATQRPSFLKRDREMKLKDKARAKAERRAAKRAAKVDGPGAPGTDDGAAPGDGDLDVDIAPAGNTTPTA